jgi:copper chaperone CopZ
VSVALKKVEGVESVKVSLKEGKAVMQLKPGNSVRLEQIRKAVAEQGFTPKEARVVAVGDLSVSDSGLQFKVAHSDDLFPIGPAPHAAWREKAGPNLLVTGIVAAPRNEKELSVLQVLEVAKESPGPRTE